MKAFHITCELAHFVSLSFQQYKAETIRKQDRSTQYPSFSATCGQK